MTTELTHWKKLHNPDYLGAWALQPNEEQILTISKVGTEEVVGSDGKKQSCSVIRFKEKDAKPMVLNVTNSKTIAKMYNTPFIEDWIGKRIQIYAAKVKAFGEEMDALRIRPKVPAKKLPELTPKHEKWAGAVKALREQTNTINGIEKFFTVSNENKQKLIEQAIEDNNA